MLKQLKKAFGRGSTAPGAARAPSASATGTAEAAFARGMSLAHGKRFHEALEAFDEVIALDPKSVAAHFNRATALGDMARLEESAAAFDRCIAMSPRFAQAHVGRGVSLVRLKRLTEARRSFDRALAIQPDSFDALEAKADLTRDEGKRTEAAALYQKLLKAQPDNERVLNGYGVALQSLNRIEEALSVFDRALLIRPAFPEALVNRGLALTGLRRYEEALASYKVAKRLDPALAGAHLNEATCELLLGQFERGWQGYEWRWKSAWWLSTQGFYGQRRFETSHWLGKSSLRRKTIFLHPEQGNGDTIQFVRYAKVLADKGARVLLEVQPPLRQLLEGLDGVAGLTSVGDPVPAHDFHCPLLSLPLACGTRIDSVPGAQGYVDVVARHPHKVAAWQKRIGQARLPRVGLAWSGNPAHPNDANRSIPFKEITPLLSGSQEFHALHSEIRSADLGAASGHPNLSLWTDDLRDFSDTAALIANLDLVVCVDTAVAHLAGAMGKPVWILLPADPDWRWLLGRDDSPWYGSARLFRQQQAGDWTGPIEDVRQSLASLQSIAA